MSAVKTKSADSSVLSPQNRPQRLFFALWPDDSLRQQLVSRSKSLVQAAQGRPVPTENLHITLAFLGNVDAQQQACIERTAETIAGSSFELALDHFGHWSRSRVLWFGPNKVPEPLTRLAAALSAGAQECGLLLGDRPYRPHLTVVRKASMRKVPSVLEKMPVEPVAWSADRFVLVRSVPALQGMPQGVSYEVLREWPLGY